MSKKMYIDAAHPEETRVAVVSRKKVEDFDFESLSRKPLRGNIYLARVTRVEPSLQAAFVEYGGNRHGFLAFSEIHSDYYQIPTRDREILREAEELEAALAAQIEAEDESDEDDNDLADGDSENTTEDATDAEGPDLSDEAENADVADTEASEDTGDEEDLPENGADVELVESSPEESEVDEIGDDDEGEEDEEEDATRRASLLSEADETVSKEPDEDTSSDNEDDDDDGDTPKSDKKTRAPREKTLEERYRDARRERTRLLKNYKIQEVIKRRQILLIQVVKEERGNKGAALTTYLSLAGRYCVLMPNTSRGGGVSRKISNGADRKRLRKAMADFEIPQGMGLIIRTAGAKRTKAEIKRDYDYLLRLWETIRALTLKSIAPCLIYEEASLIKRAIRDLYDKETEMVLVEGDRGYREAKDFMKMLMPSHAKNVQPYREQVPLFLSTGIEHQLDEMYQPVVKLKSGGYLVIQQTEALISIDVNSGKATKERNIEATALKTNLEAAAEVARQCRLRDLAGLVVVDFIDMEENRNNRAVEKRLKDSMKSDRARIQLGRISSFGLLELSRQRRRSGIVDGTTTQCPTCNGSGAVRSHEMAALRILRSVEEEAISSKVANITATTSTEVALFILNSKRDWLERIEKTYGVTVIVAADPVKAGDQYEVEKSGPPRDMETRPVVTADLASVEMPDEGEEDPVAEEEDEKPSRSKRRRRRKPASTKQEVSEGEGAAEDADSGETKESAGEDGEEEPKKKRRRGRRGGRRNRKKAVGEETADAEGSENQSPEKKDAGDDSGQHEVSGESATENNGLDESSGSNAEIDSASADSREDPADGTEEPEAIDEQAVLEADIEDTPAPAAKSDEPEIENATQDIEAPTPDAPVEADTSGEQKPRRGGWWQRALGRS